MFNGYSTHITRKIFFAEDPDEGVLTVCIDKYSLKLSPEAGELLIGYLKVIKAYFITFKDRRKLTGAFYNEIGYRLSQHSHTIQLKDISGLISLLGCITDWEKLHKVHCG